MNNQHKHILLIASASTLSIFAGKRKPIDTACQQLGQSMSAVNEDIKILKQAYPDASYVKTSRDEKLMIKNLFKNNNHNQIYLLYTGNGHLTGDWAIQSKQYPHADTISLITIIKLWKKYKNNNKSHLYIFMDCSYSGNWCYKLKLKQQQQQITVFASCDNNQPSYQYKGGLFLQCIFRKNATFEDMYDRLVKYQHPVVNKYYNNRIHVEGITKKQLEKLRQNIHNAGKVARNQMNQGQSQLKQFSKMYNMNNIKINSNNKWNINTINNNKQENNRNRAFTGLKNKSKNYYNKYDP